MNRIAVSFFGFLNFYFLLRILTQSEYGIWMLFISVTTVIELIKSGFIRNPLLKFSQDAQDQQVATASLVLNVCITIIIATSLWIFAQGLSLFWGQTSLQDLFRIFTLTLIFLIPLHHFDYIQQAHLNFKGSMFSETTRQLTLFICIFIYYVMDYPLDLIHLAFFQTLSVALSAIVSFIFARKYISLSFSTRIHWIGKLAGYGKYTLGTSVSAVIMRNTDTWMLGRMLSPLAVALYNPALRMANFLEIPAIALSSILLPKLARQISEEGKHTAKQLYEKSVGIILCFVLPIIGLTFAFAEPVIMFIAGEKYIEAAPILRVTVIYSLLLPFNRQFGVTMDAIGKAHINFLFVAKDAILNIILNYVCISHFGVIGAAYGTAITYGIALVVNQLYLSRLLQISFLGIFQSMLKSYSSFYRLGFAQFDRKH